MLTIIFLISKFLYTVFFALIMITILSIQLILLSLLKFYYFIRNKIIKNLIIYPKGFENEANKFISLRVLNFFGEIDEKMREKLK